MNVDDSGDENDRGGLLTPTTLAGLDMAFPITYYGLASINITLGSGNDAFTIDGTDSSSTLLAGGSGTDTFNVQAIDGDTLVEGGAGNATFIVGSSDSAAARTAHAISGPLMLDGGGGINTLVVTADANFTLSDSSLQLSTGGTYGLEAIQQAVLTGGPGDNVFTIDGWTGNATLNGGGGNDEVAAYVPANAVLTDSSLTLSGGGTFALSGISQAALQGSTGNNLLDATGFSGSVSLYGGAGNETLIGGWGDDYLAGGTGHDLLEAGPGDDVLVGTQGSGDTMVGGSGTDTIYGSQGPDSIIGGIGSDTIYAGPVASFISGGSGPDTIVGGASGDTIYGNGGPDVLIAGGGHNLIYADNPAGTGDTGAVSYLYGTYAGEQGAGTDTLVGGKGNDYLFGYGDTIIVGGAGSIVDNSLATDPVAGPATGRHAQPGTAGRARQCPHAADRRHLPGPLD